MSNKAVKAHDFLNKNMILGTKTTDDLAPGASGSHMQDQTQLTTNLSGVKYNENMEQFSKQISLVNKSMVEPAGNESLQLPSIKTSKIGVGTSPIRASILNI